jgi:NMD protein affecting ribosome stability and mRNA decay
MVTHPQISFLRPVAWLQSQAMLASRTKKHHTSFHRHRPVVKHVLGQQAGVPYEIERSVCATCSRVLDERPLRRAAT